MMLYHTLTVTTALIVAWISYVSYQNTQQLHMLRSDVSEHIAQQNAYQTKMIQQYLLTSEFIQKQNDAEQRATQAVKSIENQKHLTALYKVHSELLSSELLRKENKLDDASKLLKASKDVIWQSGDRYPSQKEKLQGLMQPIDEALGHWQNNHAEHSIQAIIQVITQVLESITA